MAANADSPRPSNVAALFGDDTDSQPLWFKKDAFLDKDFDAEIYVTDLRRFVPLDTLRAELKSHLTGLQNELVELINRDYTDFVNLSTKLTDVDGAVLRMRMPLSELRNKLLAVRDSVAVSLDALQEGLKRRAETSAAREMLELLLDTSHVVSKVEKLLLELESASANGGAENGASSKASGALGRDGFGEGVGTEEARSRLLERIASEMNRLRFYVARAAELPFIQSMQKRISAASATLNSHLQACLEGGLQRRDTAVIYHCLRAYASIDNAAGAEEAFRAAIVTPFVAELVPGGQAKGAATLTDVYAGVRERIERDCKFLLEIVDQPNSGLHAFHFLANSVLREVHSAISKNRPGAFSPGKPDEFLVNYKASLYFLDILEGYCPTQAQLLKFRSQPAYADFVKQWNLPAYFSIRFQDIAESLDKVLIAPVAPLAHPSPVRGPDGRLSLALQPSAVLWDSLQRCWKDDIYIPTAADRFLRLTLQLVARYTTWLRKGCEARKTASSEGGGEWARVAQAEDFVLVRHDVEAVVQLVRGPFAASVASKMGTLPAEAVESVRQTVASSADGLEVQVPTVTEVVTEGLADKCVEVVKQLKGISAAYRMTNKQLPTKHSPYVTHILKSLKDLVNGEKGVYLSADARSEVVNVVIEKVTARFDEIARELVTSVRKAESAIKRLKQSGRGRGAGADTGASAISDTDKMVAQLFLDAQEYGRQLAHFGIKAAELESYRSLWQCAAPSDQQTISF
ncbi:brefeldin A-sensitive Golgi protein-like [Klebsormidium nitens]|uniref:Conserved oligomeric Golgi complex subunit 2 n=1 Tax=Klebsormidium nitens TaxID=105231 RepID=A0A1Y1HUU8_KLENI|nr:brefeldin A-sensitive Golgi protein-like [Klebsormidium nitens]|eukprot:GAQ80959.1 brefeldin A-sensitive Golgi protein-like [Klebsormidium nitens]